MARVVFLCWPAAEISGGIKVAFQHCELLNANGIASAVATPDGARPGWFDIPAPIIPVGAVADGDVLVFPENYPAMFQRFTGSPHRKLVFCQNPFYVFQGLDGRKSFADYGVTHILGPSHTSMRYFGRRFPDLVPAYTPFFIDHAKFQCPPRKKLQIACVPRKRNLEAFSIKDFFQACHPQFKHVEWQVLHRATETEVAEVMAESAVFLSLGRLEAHGMTALEAMASGCIVAGFHGVPGYEGSDTATAANGFWAIDDDVFGCADQLARAVELAAGQGPQYRAMVDAGRRTSAAYRREEIEGTVLGFWREYLAVAPGGNAL